MMVHGAYGFVKGGEAMLLLGKLENREGIWQCTFVAAYSSYRAIPGIWRLDEKGQR